MPSGLKNKYKIRVGFILNLSSQWIGGVNYFRNLLNLIDDNKDLQIEPILFLPRGIDGKLLQGFPNVKIVTTSKLDRYSVSWLCDRLVSKILKRELFWEYIVKKYNIDILAYGNYWVRNAKKIAWIPDFQHKYLRDLFTNCELRKRDKRFAEIARNADIVILSSEDAKKDFVNYYPTFSYKAHVYRFVVPAQLTYYDAKKLRDRYRVSGKFFYIPNQFWQHKNHRLVLEALRYLRSCGNKDIKVVCSGNTYDYRNCEYFNELMGLVDRYDLKSQFIVVGRIPYKDVQSMMQECHALINPSLFEGWSTMVEEAKSIGKAIILSDLNVHEEQNPAGGIFFKRNDWRDLADKIQKTWELDDEYMNALQREAPKLLKSRERSAVCSYRRILDALIE